MFPKGVGSLGVSGVLRVSRVSAVSGVLGVSEAQNRELYYCIGHCRMMATKEAGEQGKMGGSRGSESKDKSGGGGDEGGGDEGGGGSIWSSLLLNISFANVWEYPAL